MRVTLDTNVLIAAFVSKGQCYDVFVHCAERHRLITSQFILDELRGKLLGKLKFRLERVEGAVALVLSKAHIVEPIRFEQGVCRDPDDDWVLGTALAGECDCLVTGDRALLEIGAYEGVKILSPREFWEFDRSLPPG